jgi:hypothetical protein
MIPTKNSINDNDFFIAWSNIFERFNDRVIGANKTFYELLDLLHDGTTKIPIQVRLVSEGKLKRCQRKKARAVQGRLFTLWDKYTTQTITTAELLKQASILNGPTPTQ